MEGIFDAGGYWCGFNCRQWSARQEPVTQHPAPATPHSGFYRPTPLNDTPSVRQSKPLKTGASSLKLPFIYIYFLPPFLASNDQKQIDKEEDLSGPGPIQWPCKCELTNLPGRH